MDNQGPTGGLTPHIAIADKRASEAIEFYKKAFGATENVRVPADDGAVKARRARGVGGHQFVPDEVRCFVHRLSP